VVDFFISISSLETRFGNLDHGSTFADETGDRLVMDFVSAD
jgi:hypothetical protein